MKKIYSTTKRERGFTLVEVIVAVGIFSLVMVIAISAVLAVVGANKKAQALNNVINGFNLAIESMVRDMRTGYDYECEGAQSNCDGGSEFSFQSKQVRSTEEEIEYSFANDAIYKSIGGATPQRLTSEDVVIERLAFYSKGLSNFDEFQPIVRVVIQGYADVNGQTSRFDLQTLVSARQLDIQQ